MKYKNYKGLTKLFIKESKNKELCFSKKELETIKSRAQVNLATDENGWKLEVWSTYDEGHNWRGWFEWDDVKKEGKMNVFSGSDGIGQVDQYYNCTRPQGTTYKREFETLISYMRNARLRSISNMECYKEYVARTGDMT
jgi:hypothetical protein